MNDKHLHLQFIQNIIERMSKNSFTLKGWTITVVTCLFAYLTVENHQKDILILLFIVGVFWFLDSYYLYQERLFRMRYEVVRKTNEDQIDFSLSCEQFDKHGCGFLLALFSTSELLFYVSLIVILIHLM